jgi:hypothetical protein
MNRKRGVESFLLHGCLGNGIGSAISDILADVLSNFWPIKMFLKNGHSFLHAKMSRHPTVVGFPNRLYMLTCRNLEMAQVA